MQPIDFKLAPVQVGEVVEVCISEVVAGGEGLGRLKGFAVFVPQAAIGDVLKIRIISAKLDYARGLITEILEPGPGRVAAPCSVYGVCGGCHLQHLTYRDQLDAKEHIVRQALGRLAKLETGDRVQAMLPSPDPWGYRNKAHWQICKVGRDLRVGLFKPRSHDVVEPDPCHIQHPWLNLVMAFMRRRLPEFDFCIYDERTGRGWLRSAFAKVASVTDEIMIGLVATSSKFPLRDIWVEAILEQFPNVRSVVLNVNQVRTNALLGRRTEVLFGAQRVCERLGGLDFHLSAGSFFQVNPRQAAVMFNRIATMAQLSETDVVVDCYCGIGTISLTLARTAAEVWGIEIEASAIADANENARLNRIENAHFLVGKTEERLPKLLKDGLEPDIIVLDPPRKGCAPEVVAAVAHAKPKRLIYVSCNPATLARDLAALAKVGYFAQSVQSLDMFPQTAHVEAVALLTRAIS